MLSSNASDSDSDSELKNIIFTLGASSNPLAQKYAAKVQKKLSKKIFFFLLFFLKLLHFAFEFRATEILLFVRAFVT